MTTEAKFILSTQDKTAADLARLRKNFSDLDNGAKKLAQGLKSVGVAAVVLKGFNTLARSADTAIGNLASTNTEFARSLKVSEDAFKAMRTAGEQTIAAQLRLNEVLADPKAVESLKNLSDETAAWYIGLKKTAVDGAIWLDGLFTKMEKVQRKIALASPFGAAGELARIAGEQERDTAIGGFQSFTPNVPMPRFDLTTAESRAAFAQMQRDQAEFTRVFESQRDDAYAAIGDTFQEEADRHREYFIEPTIAGFEELRVQAETVTAGMSAYADQAARNMQDAFAEFLFDPFEDGVKGMLKGFTDALRQMIAQQAAAGVFNWLGGKSGAGGVLGAVGSFIAGARADGGPVSGGKSYLVGERGPELFTPGSSGHITPNGGKAVVIHSAPIIHVNASQLTQDQAARMVADSQKRMWDELDRRYGLA